MEKPIRVLHVVTYMGRGGLETMLMNYYRHIDRTKVQFDFLVHREFEADYDQEILSMGGRIFHVSRLIPWSRSYKKELKHFFNQHKEYKIIHVHQDCLSSVALKCAKECGIPIRIAHSHSSNAVFNLKYFIKRFYMLSIPKYATDLLACGKSAGDWMFRGSPYQVVHNAIDTSKFHYDDDIRKKIRSNLEVGKELLVGHVGNFTNAKNHPFLIEAFAEVLKNKPDAKLILVGGGDNQQKIKDIVLSHKIEKNVIFTGIRKDVNELLQAIDVFVFPSIYEGLPVTIIEAQAAGLPCVISNCISSECIVTKNLVTTKSLNDAPEEWAQQILKKSRLSRTDHVKEIINAGYDINTVARFLEEYYCKKAVNDL